MKTAALIVEEISSQDEAYKLTAKDVSTLLGTEKDH